MEYRRLGRTELKVSRLCFGSLSLSPLQGNLSVGAGAKVIRSALEAGLNFIDTAEYYQNYNQIRAGIAGHSGLHIASKSYAVTSSEMEKSIKKALTELDLAEISLFLLHEQESAATLRGHQGALHRLVRAKESGLVKAIGVSTHYVAGVRAAASIPEIDVIHPLINLAGIGIVDGSLDDMVEAIKYARAMGKGIYGMKALAGGHLHRRVAEALTWAFSQDFLDSVAVGMKSELEVKANIALINGDDVSELLNKLSQKKKALLIEEWCRGCGSCVERCPNKALSIHGGRARVAKELCVLCGYCGAVCPEFALKII